MVRNFQDRPVDPSALRRILEHGQRAPSAGYTQGYRFLVFVGEETAAFWDAACSPQDPMRIRPGVLRAPVIIVPLVSKKAYLDRYAEPDKGWTDRDESRWPAPFWALDAAFAAMLMLLTAVDEGLGALFFGLYPPENLPRFRGSFGIPDEYEPIGAIAVGHPAADDIPSSAARGRLPLDEVVHRSRW